MSAGSRVSLILVIVSGLSGIAFVGPVLAQNPHAAPPVASKMQMPAPQIDQRGQAMMAGMQADQKKLDDLVAAMNAATGADRVDRIAAVVTELAARQNRMSARMMTMMRGGMMMKMGPEATAPEQPAAPGSDHERHHPQQ